MKLKGKPTPGILTYNIRYALNVGSQHFSSSAKSGAGVNEIFRNLTESKHYSAC